jgi:hypothetical protein
MPLERVAAHLSTAAAGRAGGVAVVVAACLACGCSSLLPPPEHNADLSPDNKAAANAVMVTQHLQVLQRLMQGTPSDKADIVAAAQHDFDTMPSPSKKLRLALILGTPDQPATDLPRAQRLLSELMARPEELVPGERSLAFLELQQIEDHLTWLAETRRLQTDAGRADRERLAALNHRLQQEVDENTRLRKDLDEAKAKLDAIATIESSPDEHKPRKPSTEGRSP